MTSEIEHIGLGEIVRKLDAIEQSVNGILKDHETRLRSLEKWMYAVPPTLAIALASIVTAVLKG